MKVASRWMIANIASDDVLILPHRAVSKKHNRAIIAVDVRRFGHLINKNEVFGTHRSTQR